MNRFGLTLIGAATVLGAAVAIHPADAAPVAPNGSETLTVSGPSSVSGGGSADINAGTTTITLGGTISLGSFTDPFPALGPANNFCGAAGAGCLAANAPGFLLAGDIATLTSNSLPVQPPLGPKALAPHEQLTITDSAGNVVFDFSSIFTTVLDPTLVGHAGTVTVDLTGTFFGDSRGAYTTGQSADAVVSCAQTTPGGGVGCLITVDTPSVVTPPVPEPASLALLGSALVGFGAFRRRRRKTA